MAAPKILIFDSGAGGLSVAKEIVKTIPNYDIVYAADNAFYPYGLKEDLVLTQRIIELIGQLHRREAPDIVVIACNTASTLALKQLRNEFKCPFVGVVPAIKPASTITQSGVIGLLATPATISRPYTSDLIKQFAQDKKVISFGSNSLVELAEQKLTTGKCCQNKLEEIISEFIALDPKMDTAVLACTHFPLIKREMDKLTKLMGHNIRWVDSGEAIARRVQNLLPTNTVCNTNSIRISFSADTPVTEKKAQTYKSYLNGDI